MRFSAEIINGLNVFIIMAVFSFVVLSGVLSEKKITNKLSEEKPINNCYPSPKGFTIFNANTVNKFFKT
jgi:hypothetical protein